MKIKTEELRRFLSAAGQIKLNPTATNLDSIKIQCTGQEIIFTKTNNNIWCKYNYVCQPSAPEIYLINERMLNGVILTTKEYEIEVYLDIDGENLLITSGEDIVKTRAQDMQLFPAIQEAKGDRALISKDAIERIRIASKYKSNAPNRTAMNFVQIGMDGIFAANGSILYYHNTFPLPEVFFDDEPLNIMRSTDDMYYWTSETYDFFQSEGFTFGFIKSVVKPLPFLPIVQQQGTEWFNCKKDDFIDFCTLVQYSKRQENPEAVFQSHPEKADVLLIEYNDADFNIIVDRRLTIESNVNVQPFRFNVDWVALMLKTLPYQVLKFTRLGNGHYGITTEEDKNFTGIIARLADKQTE